MFPLAIGETLFTKHAWLEAEWEPHELGDFSKLRMCVPEEEMAEWDIEQVGPPELATPTL